MKKLLILALALFALPAFAIDTGRDKGEPDDDGAIYQETYDAMSLRLPDNSAFRASRLVLVTPEGSFAADLTGQVRLRNEDLIRTDWLPPAFDVFAPRLSAKDFDPAQKIGVALRDGEALVLVLDQAQEAPGIVVANQRVSFHVKAAALRPGDSALVAGLQEVGRVFAMEDALLVEVRPSILTGWE